MKKVVLNAQLQCLPERDKERAAGRGPFSRLVVCLLFLMVGLVLVVFWISYPALRLVLLIGAAILGGFIFYRFKERGFPE
jgi:hypothetical protein